MRDCLRRIPGHRLVDDGYSMLPIEEFCSRFASYRRICTNRKCKRDCNDECSPHFSFPRVFTVERALDGQPMLTKNAESFFAVLAEPSTSSPHERESNSLC